jgi:activator of 2-hydroxyglutaryl-CoA dehydratase
VDGGPIVFSGGVALNACMQTLLKDAFKQEIFIPPEPQLMGALGASLLMEEMVE